MWEPETTIDKGTWPSYVGIKTCYFALWTSASTKTCFVNPFQRRVRNIYPALSLSMWPFSTFHVGRSSLFSAHLGMEYSPNLYLILIWANYSDLCRGLGESRVQKSTWKSMWLGGKEGRTFSDRIILGFQTHTSKHQVQRDLGCLYRDIYTRFCIWNLSNIAPAGNQKNISMFFHSDCAMVGRRSSGF